MKNTLMIRAVLIVGLLAFCLFGPYPLHSLGKNYSDYYTEKKNYVNLKMDTETYHQSVIQKESQFKAERGSDEYLQPAQVIAHMSKVSSAKVKSIHTVKISGSDKITDVKQVSSVQDLGEYDGLKFVYSTANPKDTVRSIEKLNYLVDNIKVDFYTKTVTAVVRLKEVK